MKKLLLSAACIVLALSGCSKNEGGGTAGAPSGKNGESAQVAYGYTYRFALPGAAVTPAQDRHIALCDQLGETRCRMQEMHRSAATGNSTGSTLFVVASGDARRFGQALVAPIQSLNGRLTSRDFEAEDMSKQIAQAQATQADKNTAANRTTLSDARARVATSAIWVYYDSKASFSNQVGDAFGSAGETIAGSIVALIYFLAAALPWAIVLGALFYAIRAIVRRVRRLFTTADRHANAGQRGARDPGADSATTLR